MFRYLQERGLGYMLAAMLLALAVIGAGRPASATEPAVGRVVQQQGDARVVRDGEDGMLAIGAPIFVRDRFETGENGRLKIEFADRSLLVIGNGTRIFVADYAISRSGQRLGAMLSLLSGIVRAVIASPGGHFDIGSRAAVASARSTEWLMEADAGETAVFASAGRVAVQAVGTNATVLLQPGEGTDVPAEGAPTQPKLWGQARVEAFLARTRVDGE